MASRHTLFLDTDDIALLIRQRGLALCLTELADYLHADFLRWQQFDKCARVASHSVLGVIELMPISDGQRYAFKYVNGHPCNTRLGLPTVMAFGVLAEVESGTPLLLSELSIATALRTAATSALAARALARHDAKVMALIGCGAQSEFQALGFQTLLGIRRLRVFDVDVAAMDKLCANLRGSSLHIEPCASAHEAVRGADIVTTLTADKTRAAIITPDMLVPGLHINAVGGDCPGKTELHPGVLARASVFVEYAPQTRIEGDIQQMPPDFPVTELWRVLAGEEPGRRDAAALTVFDSVGFALEDFSVLRYLYDMAQAMQLGRRVSLVAVPGDPKNLFGMLDGAMEARSVLNKHVTPAKAGIHVAAKRSFVT